MRIMEHNMKPFGQSKVNQAACLSVQSRAGSPFADAYFFMAEQFSR